MLRKYLEELFQLGRIIDADIDFTNCLLPCVTDCSASVAGDGTKSGSSELNNRRISMVQLPTIMLKCK